MVWVSDWTLATLAELQTKCKSFISKDIRERWWTKSLRVRVDESQESWYDLDNSATDGLCAHLGRKGAQTGADQLSTATPNAAKELTAQ